MEEAEQEVVDADAVGDARQRRRQQVRSQVQAIGNAVSAAVPALPDCPRRRTVSSTPIGPDEPPAVWLLRPHDSRAAERDRIARLRDTGGEAAVRADAARNPAPRREALRRANTSRSTLVAAMAKAKVAPHDPLTYPEEEREQACRLHDLK